MDTLREKDSPMSRIDGKNNGYFGVYPAVVVNNSDPDGQGRVRVSIPVQGIGRLGTWARLATMMAGKNRGSWFVPDVDDEVLVAFEGGDMRMPYVIGSLWNGHDSPPEAAGQGNDKKILCSRNGVQIILDDTDGRETLKLETPGGQKLVLKDGPGEIKITDSNGNEVTLTSKGITVNASYVEITANLVKVDAAQSTFSGTIKADTVVTKSVVSDSYSPGVGNIW